MAKEHILIVDDEEDILELLRVNLLREGYMTTGATTGEIAVEKALTEKIDLIILDLMLPGIDGFSITKKLKGNRKTKDIPIIMLTAKGDEADIVTGLELGADDYVTKPFSPKILIARVRTALRRNRRDEDLSEIIKIHELVIDSGKHIVSAKDKKIDLTYSEFKTLVFLAKRPGWVFTRSQIVDAIRGDNYAVTDRSIDVLVVALRKKLGKFSEYIETVRGVGYRFRE